MAEGAFTLPLEDNTSEKTPLVPEKTLPGERKK